MEKLTHLFLNTYTIIKSLLEKLYDFLGKNILISKDGRIVGFIGRDGCYSLFGDEAINEGKRTVNLN